MESRPAKGSSRWVGGCKEGEGTGGGGARSKVEVEEGREGRLRQRWREHVVEETYLGRLIFYNFF